MERGYNIKYLYCFILFSETPTPPPGLNYRLMSRDCTCDDPVQGSTTVTCTCQTADLLLFWEEASGMFEIECYVVTVFQSDDTPPPISPNMCNMASSNICIKATNSTTLDFPACILPGRRYSVRVWTVSRCGVLSSSPAMLQNVHVGKRCIYLRL